MMRSWKTLCENPEFCPIMVKNSWHYFNDFNTTLKDTLTDTDVNGNTLLHLAVYGLLEDEVAKLISMGADVNAANVNGFKPHHMLMESIMMCDSRCEVTKKKVHVIFKLLMENGVVDTRVLQGIDDSPLYSCAEFMDKCSILKKKADALDVSRLFRLRLASLT